MRLYERVTYYRMSKRERIRPALLNVRISFTAELTSAVEAVAIPVPTSHSGLMAAKLDVF